MQNRDMKLTPFQKKIICLDRSLYAKDKEIEQWVIDNARPSLAIRQNNMVTVCFGCGNTMVYAGDERYVRCIECDRNVEIVEEQDWLASKRMMSRYFASLEVIDGIQLMRTYNVIFRYSAINRLKDASVQEICRHWITSDGRCDVTSLRRFFEWLPSKHKSMKLRRGSTETEDQIANRAMIVSNMALIPEMTDKIVSTDKLRHGNALTIIRDLLEPEYLTI